MSSLQVSEHQGQLVVDSRLIAEELGVEHRAFLQTLKKYQDKIEQRFGVVAFEMSKPSEGGNGGRPEKYALLSEAQATTLMTFSRNTEQVVECKLRLVEAFEKAKQVIKGEIPTKEPQQRSLPQRDAIEYIEASKTLESLQDGILKRLLQSALVDELSLAQNTKALPSATVATAPKYTIVKVRARELGFSHQQIKNGSGLGGFVAKKISPAFSERVGNFVVKHYEVTPELDEAIHKYFSLKAL